MAYTKLTDFAVKDALLTGNPAKVVRGTEIDAELNAIAAADALNLSAASIVAATSKATPIDADLIPLIDSAASNVLKKLTWANLKATVKTYFDTLYLGISATAANASQLLGATWASPGPIGSTTPSTGAFTTLSATGNVTLGDASTDTVTVNGCIGVGIAANPAIGLQVYSAALTGTNQYGVTGQPTATAAATDSVTGVYASPQTTAAAFTLTDMRGFWVGTGTKGSGSTITNQHGVYINDQTKGTNNYGITSLVSAGTNKWNIYASGTAANYFAGDITTSSNVTFSGVGAVTQAAQNAYTRVIGGTTANVDPTVTLYGSTHANAGLATYDAATHRFRSATGTEYSRIDASGNLGVGLTPIASTAKIQSKEATASSVGGLSSFAGFQANAAGHFTKLTLGTDTGSSLAGVAAKATTYGAGGAYPNNVGSLIGFAQNLGSTITCFETQAGSSFALEGATLSTGIGIAFPATQVASSNANTLDDYEYGSFTATIDGTTTAGTGTYTTQVGRYKKIGRLVQFQLNLVWSSHTGTGNLKVSGLPFITGSTANSFAAVSIYNAGIAMTAGSVMQAYTNVSGTTIVLEQVPTGGGSSTAIPMDTAGQIILTGTYESA